MLDLQKYLRRASADPGFRKRLLQNANQAIKDEFGEDLPYELKCKEKLIFEVESIDDFSDADAKKVSGGNDAYNKFAKMWAQKANKDGFIGDARLQPTQTLKDKLEGTKPLPTLQDAIDSNYFGPLPQNPQYGELSERNLGGVSGGNDAYNKFVKGLAQKANKDGFIGDARLQPTQTLKDKLEGTRPLPTLQDAIDSNYFGPLPQNPQYGELSERNLGGVAGGNDAYNVDYKFSSRPELPPLGRANGRLGARPYPKAFPPSFRKSRWRSVYHPGNYDDFFVESQQYLRNKNNSELNFR